MQRICSPLQVELRDLWLVDSGATCHVLAASYASSFRIVENYGVSPKLFNASCDEIAVEGLVEIELSFQGLEITLQEVIVAHVAFNALSPWAEAEHGWKTYLGKSGSRMFQGRRSVKLSAPNRAWWAISGKKGKGSSRGKDGNASQPMELDSLSVFDSGSPDAGAQKKEVLDLFHLKDSASLHSRGTGQTPVDKIHSSSPQYENVHGLLGRQSISLNSQQTLRN